MAVSPLSVSTFQRDGAVFLPGLFSDWVDAIAAGIDKNMAEPGEFLNHYGTADGLDPETEGLAGGRSGLFFDDYCNWRRIPEFERCIRESQAAEVAAALMGSTTARFFHDHVLVKEPGVSQATPWHSDNPYYFIDGTQTVSFWIPIDPVDDATLRLVRGSHRWPLETAPTSWADGSAFYATPAAGYRESVDPDTDAEMTVLAWPMQPGDAVAFDFRTTHGARPNHNRIRRRAFSMRWVGDDARYLDRGERTSPPFPGHGMKPGDRLRDDWFPVLHPS